MYRFINKLHYKQNLNISYIDINIYLCFLDYFTKYNVKQNTKLLLVIYYYNYKRVGKLVLFYVQRWSILSHDRYRRFLFLFEWTYLKKKKCQENIPPIGISFQHAEIVDDFILYDQIEEQTKNILCYNYDIMIRINVSPQNEIGSIIMWTF